MAEGRTNERRIGRYALHGEIASGGMATVHFGRLVGPAGFSRTVAIKRLHPQFAKDPEFVAMFLDEARLAARISHPNVVATLDVVTAENELLLVMEYVHGESLSRAAPQPLEESRERRCPCDRLEHRLRAARTACTRPTRPRTSTGARSASSTATSPRRTCSSAPTASTRVLDFGVAKAVGRAQTTRDGQLKGKFAYMAPEQLRAAASTAAPTSTPPPSCSGSCSRCEGSSTATASSPSSRKSR